MNHYTYYIIPFVVVAAAGAGDDPGVHPAQDAQGSIAYFRARRPRHISGPPHTVQWYEPSRLLKKGNAGRCDGGGTERLSDIHNITV